MTAAPQRLRLSRRRGFDLQAVSRAANGLAAVSVARPGPWGNPFVVGAGQDAAFCVRLHGLMLAGLYLMDGPPSVDEQRAARNHVAAHIGDLAGRNLACWCAPGRPCHGDTLLRLAREAAS